MTGFTLSFALEAAFLVIAVVAALLVPTVAQNARRTGTDAGRAVEVGGVSSARVKLEVS